METIFNFKFLSCKFAAKYLVSRRYLQQSQNKSAPKISINPIITPNIIYKLVFEESSSLLLLLIVEFDVVLAEKESGIRTNKSKVVIKNYVFCL